MTDPFDAVTSAEERLFQAGYEEGLERGRLEGRMSGFTTGQVKGMELGDELGYYLGFAEMLQELKLDGRQNDKVQRLASSLAVDVRGFCCLHFSSPSYQDGLCRIRAKFKQISSILKFKEPEGINKFQAKQQSF